MDQSTYRLSVLAVVGCATLAGFSGMIIKAVTYLEPSALTWLRLTVPALFTAVVLRIQGISFFRFNYPKLLLASVLNAVRMYFYIAAFLYTTIANAVILFYTWPIFAAILGRTYLKEQLPMSKYVWMLVAFAGLIFAYSNKTFSFEDSDFFGMFSAIMAAFLYSITVILFKSERSKHTTMEMLFYQNIAGSILYLPFFLWAGTPLILSDIGLGIGYGLLAGVLIFGLFFYGLNALSATTASSIMYLEVVSAILVSVFWLKDSLETPMIIGGMAIVISSLMITRLR